MRRNRFAGTESMRVTITDPEDRRIDPENAAMTDRPAASERFPHTGFRERLVNVRVAVATGLHAHATHRVGERHVQGAMRLLFRPVMYGEQRRYQNQTRCGPGTIIRTDPVRTE